MTDSKKIVIPAALMDTLSFVFNQNEQITVSYYTQQDLCPHYSTLMCHNIMW